jgi:hypothetical protein
VIETRQNVGSLRRRRRCLACPGRITTIEIPAPEHSKRNTTELVAIPARHAAELEVVSRHLMQALRDLMRAHDVETAAPDEHW